MLPGIKHMDCAYGFQLTRQNDAHFGDKMKPIASTNEN